MELLDDEDVLNLHAYSFSFAEYLQDYYITGVHKHYKNCSALGC